MLVEEFCVKESKEMGWKLITEEEVRSRKGYFSEEGKKCRVECSIKKKIVGTQETRKNCWNARSVLLGGIQMKC